MLHKVLDALPENAPESAALRADTLLLLGMVYHQENDNEQAQKFFEHAAALGVHEAHLHLGFLHGKIGNHAQAREHLGHPAIKDAPAALFAVGLTYKDEGDIEQAKTLFKRVADQNEDLLYQFKGSMALKKLNEDGQK